MALLASISSFAHVLGWLTNKGLRAQMTVLWHADYTPAQATYDLRRLRLKGFIECVAGTNTYRVTDHGLRIAGFFTQLAVRVVILQLTDLADLARAPTTRRAPATHHRLAHLRAGTTPPTTHHQARRVTRKHASTIQNPDLKRR